MFFSILKSLFGWASPQIKKQDAEDMARQLESVATGGDPEILTAGIGMIRLGSKELLPGWMRLLSRSQVYSAGVGATTIDGAFLFAPPGSPSQALEYRTALPIFTKRGMAEEVCAMLPKTGSVIECSGREALRFAHERKLSISFNLLSDTCSFSIPKEGVEAFLAEIEMLAAQETTRD